MVRRAVAVARAKGARVLLDPAPAPENLPPDLIAVERLRARTGTRRSRSSDSPSRIPRRRRRRRGSCTSAARALPWSSWEPRAWCGPMRRGLRATGHACGGGGHDGRWRRLCRGMRRVPGSRYARRGGNRAGGASAARSTTSIGAQPALPWLADIETAHADGGNAKGVWHTSGMNAISAT